MDTAELILWGIPALFICFLVCVIVGLISKSKNDTAYSKESDDYIKKNNITCTRDLSFNGYNNRCRFIADDNEKVIYICSQATGLFFKKIPYRDIMSVNISQQNVNTTTIGGSFFAGAMDGIAGRYTGPTPRQTFVENYNVIIMVQDIQHPQIILPLIKGSQTRFDSDEYKNADSFAKEIQAIVRVIQSRSLFDLSDFINPY